jgi:hypothetical protein
MGSGRSRLRVPLVNAESHSEEVKAMKLINWQVSEAMASQEYIAAAAGVLDYFQMPRDYLSDVILNVHQSVSAEEIHVKILGVIYKWSCRDSRSEFSCMTYIEGVCAGMSCKVTVWQPCKPKETL